MEDETRKRGAVKSMLTTFRKYITSLKNKTENGEALSEVELSMPSAISKGVSFQDSKAGRQRTEESASTRSVGLDAAAAREWEEIKIERELPTFENLKSFLKSKADMLETLDNVSCSNYKKEHPIYNCGEFAKLNVNERLARTKELKLCINCLRPDHYTRTCRMGTCKRCNSKHHTLLYHEVEKAQKEEMTKEAISLTSHCESGFVILSTALVQVRDSKNKIHSVRALLDNGSQSN
ncbi:hypothetical protein CBL_02905 [Carabus blaptoides fortunei]